MLFRSHDAVAAVVLHKHHLIIRVGAGLIQFVYGSHLCLAADLTLDKNLFSLPFSRDFLSHGCRKIPGLWIIHMDSCGSGHPRGFMKCLSTPCLLHNLTTQEGHQMVQHRILIPWILSTPLSATPFSMVLKECRLPGGSYYLLISFTNYKQ